MFSSNTSAVSGDTVYVENVFSTYAYTGNVSSPRTIVNNIDLATKGGLVWIKSRTYSDTNYGRHVLSHDATTFLTSNSAVAAASSTNRITAFNNDGFTLGNSESVNDSAPNTYASWTFRKQPKFFDIVTYTGTGGSQTLNHNLGSTPGCIIVKCTSAGSTDWYVYHRSLNDNSGNPYFLLLNRTYAQDTGGGVWGTPTSTQFTVQYPNASGQTYVAYLFAHNAGGFGLTGADNVISCGSFTSDSSGLFSVNLGYEPQWLMIKRVDTAQDWYIQDTMRGFANLELKLLTANSSSSESDLSPTAYIHPDPTGFSTPNGIYGANGTFIYVAVRKGPMKVPTDATTVFAPIARTGTSSTASVTSGFVTDLAISHDRGTSGADALVEDRLRGATKWMTTTGTNAEATRSDALTSFASMTGVVVGADSSTQAINYSGFNYANWFFRRAPSFFDVVCYTGTSAGTNRTHNLGVTPELKIIKCRSNAYGWYVGGTIVTGVGGRSTYMTLNSSNAVTTSSDFWAAEDTSTDFSVRAANYALDYSGYTYVAYLFATCPGVSKVGSYTGTGSTQTINCGFTGGARFVLVKRTDSTGDWRVVDTARGMVSGNDPYLRLNTTDGEVNVNNLYTATGGFQLVSSDTNFNANGGTYIYLAIA